MRRIIRERMGFRSAGSEEASRVLEIIGRSRSFTNREQS